MIKSNLRIISAAGLVLVGGMVLSASSAMAGCGPGYKPIKWKDSGNTVCVLIAGYPTNNLTAKPSRPLPAVSLRKSRLQALQPYRAARRKR